MSRVEENENMIQPTKTTFHGKTDDVLCQIKGQELGVLVDISKSLAVIADCCLDQRKKLYCDYTGLDEDAIINRLKKTSTVDQFNDKYGRRNDGD